MCIIPCATKYKNNIKSFTFGSTNSGYSEGFSNLFKIRPKNKLE